jgi:hypothetical protein
MRRKTPKTQGTILLLWVFIMGDHGGVLGS